MLIAVSIILIIALAAVSIFHVVVFIALAILIIALAVVTIAFAVVTIALVVIVAALDVFRPSLVFFWVFRASSLLLLCFSYFIVALSLRTL